MFLQFKKINNESGVVLFIVLMTAIIIMIYSLGILTQSLNEINYAQQQIDQISSEQLTKGIFWNSYANAFSAGSSSSSTTPSTSSGRIYQTNMSTSPSTNSICPPPTCLNVNVVTNYDTFQ